MPNKKSAIKALRQSNKKALRNFKVKRTIKELVKDSKKLIVANEKTAAEKVKSAVKAIDKAIQNKVLQKNTGARKKSRLMKKLNKMGK